jgi:DNA-binding FrmR family transcriptional regulator
MGRVLDWGWETLGLVEDGTVDNTLPGYGIFQFMTEVAVALDEQVQKNALRRLSIIEGQVRGLRRMVEESTGCVEILTQISAIHEALRGVGKVVVRHHIETCVTDGLKTDKKQQHQDELMDLIYKLSK